MGVRDGNTSDSPETSVAIKDCVALGRDGVRGLVADRKAYCKRTLGVCLEQGVELITLGPRTCAVRQEPPRRWHGHSVVRHVPVE
jgi:hypothetical protein